MLGAGCRGRQTPAPLRDLTVPGDLQRGVNAAHTLLVNEQSNLPKSALRRREEARLIWSSRFRWRDNWEYVMSSRPHTASRTDGRSLLRPPVVSIPWALVLRLLNKLWALRYILRGQPSTARRKEAWKLVSLSVTIPPGDRDEAYSTWSNLLASMQCRRAKRAQQPVHCEPQVRHSHLPQAASPLLAKDRMVSVHWSCSLSGRGPVDAALYSASISLLSFLTTPSSTSMA